MPTLATAIRMRFIVYLLGFMSLPWGRNARVKANVPTQSLCRARIRDQLSGPAHGLAPGSRRARVEPSAWCAEGSPPSEQRIINLPAILPAIPKPYDATQFFESCRSRVALPRAR